MDKIEYLCPFLKDKCNHDCMFRIGKDNWQENNLYENCIISKSLATIANTLKNKDSD